jgi:putative glycosyltransferase (TIGR04372 family)
VSRILRNFLASLKLVAHTCLLVPSLLATLLSLRTPHTFVLMRSLVLTIHKLSNLIRAESLINSPILFESYWSKWYFGKRARTKILTLEAEAESVYRRCGHFDATKNFIELTKIQTKESRQLLGKDTLLLGPGWISAFGHLSNLSLFPKIEKLEWRKFESLLIAGSQTSNPAMLDLYKSWYKVLNFDLRTQITFDLYFRNSYQNMNAIEVRDSQLRDLYTAQFEIEEAIRVKFGDSFHLLEVPREVAALGKSYLESHNFDPESWFVTLHMRETGDIGKYKGGDDVNPRTYVDAINTILDLGGQVIRIGNSSMTSLKDLGVSSRRVLDYAKVEGKNPQLDVYFLGSCRYMIGTGSGPATFPNEFGRPVLYTNCPAIGRTFRLRGLSTPQLLRRRNSGELLSLNEMLNSPFGWNVSPSNLEIERVPNTTTEIVAGVLEIHSLTEKAQSGFWIEPNVKCHESRIFSNWNIGVPIADSFLSEYQEVFCG